jgi:GNAT superfamily N-acetyltransferase
MLTLYTALDRLHADARPDCCVLRDEVYPREHYEANLTNPISFQMGAFDESNRMVGLVDATLWHESVMVKDVKTVCLDNIYVLPEYRRRGVAANLFDAVEQWAREQGAVRLDLHTWDFNKDAIALYRTMGMTPQRHVFEKHLNR